MAQPHKVYGTNHPAKQQHLTVRGVGALWLIDSWGMQAKGIFLLKNNRTN